MKTKRFISLLLVVMLLVVIIVLVACGTSGAEETSAPESEQTTDSLSGDSDDTFWILTVMTGGDQLRYQINDAVEYFQEKYPDRQVNVEYLPYDNVNELTMRLTQLRTEILAGKGPDVFIFPTNRTALETRIWNSVYGTSSLPYELLLFTDVNQTIRNGHFLDISAQYDADTELGKEALNTTIMDAGIYEGARYVLPLRYDMPVYVVDTSRISETGKDLNWLEQTDVISMMDEAIATNHSILAGCSYPCLLWRGHIFSYFPDAIDYETGNVDLTVEELAALLEKAEAVEDLCGDRQYNWGLKIRDYVEANHSFVGGKYPVMQMLLSEAMDVAAMCKVKDIDYTMLPCRAADGSVVAHITWYGAVGSSCDEPDVAYDFLRLFLTEEYQWEQKRLRNKDIENPSMVAEGFPVRSKGAAEYVGLSGWRQVRHYGEGSINYDENMQARIDEFKEVSLTDADLPFLDFEIDVVRFPSNLERKLLNEIYRGYDDQGYPLYANTTAMAEEMIKQLRYQLAEG